MKGGIIIKRTIKSIRADLGLNQLEFAKKLGISQATLQKKETGKNPLLARELALISQISNVPMEDIKIPL